MTSEGIPVNNAGLVLLNGYIELLFDRLGLFNGSRTFLNAEAPFYAIKYLQFLATGTINTEKDVLVLNNILCGVPLLTPIKHDLEVSATNKELIESLIKAAIGQWPQIGQSSIDGFRGNWLLREGLLVEYADRWELTVEKKAYDILIARSPFSLSVIKYPWMDKPIHVNWPN